MTQQKSMMLKQNRIEVIKMLEKAKGEMARCLPAHMTPERLSRIALTEFRKNPMLQECDPVSFVAAIMQAAQLGLEPGVLGSCYLIPFRNRRMNTVECTFIPGYRGFLDLARRSGQIVSLIARAVYENDEFSYEFGLNEKLLHKPDMKDPGQLVAVYAVAHLKDGGHQFEVMSRRDVEVVRNQSKSRDTGPWATHFDEMAKKTVIRKLFKWLPCSVEMQKAVSLDELQEIGKQNVKAAAAEEFDLDFITDADFEEVEAEEKVSAKEGLTEALKRSREVSGNDETKGE